MMQRKCIRRVLRRLCRDQRGAVAVTFLLSATVILGGAFGAIDLVRHNVAQGRLQHALDAAVISAGRNLANRTPTPGSPDADAWLNDAHQFFRSNMPEGYLGSSVSTENLQIDYHEDKAGEYTVGQFVDMSVTGELPLFSTGFLKVTAFGLAASNQAIRRTRSDLEVVMVLDNTGSMSSQSRMTHLKDSSKMLVNMVLGAAEANDNSRTFIGLVPFTHLINVGNTPHTRAWLTPYWQSNLFVTDGAWTGCITEPRPAGRPMANITAQGVGPGHFQPLVAIGTDTRQVLGMSGSSPRNISTSARIVQGSQRTQMAQADRGFAAAMDQDPLHQSRFISEIVRVSSQDRLMSTFQINRNDCTVNDRRVMFLTQNKNELNSAIDDMSAEGWTLIPAGILWGWRMLHPDWQGQWGGPSVPLEDGGTELLPRPAHPDLTKVLIVLTDGANSIDSYSVTARKTFSNYALQFQYQTVSTTSTDVTGSYGNQNACSRAGYRWVQGGWFSPSRCWRDEEHLSSPVDASLNVAGNNTNRTFSVAKNDRSFNALNDEAYNLVPSGISDLDAYTLALCANIKNPAVSDVPGGIRIYTIALGSSITNSVRNLMTACASPNGFYDSTNVNDLSQAFESIAGDLMELRLTR